MILGQSDGRKISEVIAAVSSICRGRAQTGGRSVVVPSVHNAEGLCMLRKVTRIGLGAGRVHS